MRWLPLLCAAALLLGGDAEVRPINVRLEITGYRMEGSIMSVIVTATNQEPTPVSYWSEQVDSPFIRLSWQENDAWVKEQIHMCGVGSREQILAAGEQREFAWRVGSGRVDLVTGTTSWSWVPTSLPIRVGLRFCRPVSPDWWDALSEPSEIDEMLRPLMLRAVAAQKPYAEPVQAGADAHCGLSVKAPMLTSLIPGTR